MNYNAEELRTNLFLEKKSLFCLVIFLAHQLYEIVA